MKNLSIDELLNKAFSLACFILGSREDAVRTVEEAMARLTVTTVAQGKRLYYKSSSSSWLGQEKGDRYRNKVLFSELHLLQRLVYITSEPYEQKQEQKSKGDASGEETLLIHFIKHLVRVTTRRNSFYVTLGLSRLLYNYTTAETMEVYNAVIQDPERVKDDYYYRSRKGVLMQELKKRFGDFVEVARGPRGEERFRASDQQSRFKDLVAECLSFFTPWYTPCLVPAGVNPIIDGIESLSSHGQQQEDKVEVDRIHAILHPTCHERLIDSLGFESPAQRLEAPHFYLTEDNGRGDGRRDFRRFSSVLDQSELDEIKGHLDVQSGRRRKAFAGLLRVLVDGSERARIDLAHASRAKFALDEDAELLEVRATVDGDDLLLASHLFVHQESNSDEKLATSIVLEGGQKLAISVAPSTHAEGALVDVAYSETNPLRAASRFLWKLTQPGDRQASVIGWNPLRAGALAVAAVLLMVLAFGVIQFLRQRGSSNSPAEVATSPQPEAVENPQNPTTANVTPPAPANIPADAPRAGYIPEQKSVAKKATPRSVSPAPEGPEVATADPPRRSSDIPRPKETPVAQVPESDRTPELVVPSESNTRDPARRMRVLKLPEVRNIYLETIGDESLRESVRGQLIEQLNTSGRFQIAESKDSADARLQVNVSRIKDEPGKIAISAVMINPLGEKIWSSQRVVEGASGSAEIVAAGVIKGLLDEAKKLERRR
jgi:hypothetical protein